MYISVKMVICLVLLFIAYRFFFSSSKNTTNLRNRLPASGKELDRLVRTESKEAIEKVWDHLSIIAVQMKPDLSVDEARIAIDATIGNMVMVQMEQGWNNGDYYVTLKKNLDIAVKPFCKDNIEIFIQFAKWVLTYLIHIKENYVICKNFKTNCQYFLEYFDHADELQFDKDFKEVQKIMESATIGGTLMFALLKAEDEIDTSDMKQLSDHGSELCTLFQSKDDAEMVKLFSHLEFVGSQFDPGCSDGEMKTAVFATVGHILIIKKRVKNKILENKVFYDTLKDMLAFSTTKFSNENLTVFRSFIEKIDFCMQYTNVKKCEREKFKRSSEAYVEALQDKDDTVFQEFRPFLSMVANSTIGCIADLCISRAMYDK